MTIHVLSRAYHDISEIWNYIAADNPTAADEQEEQFFAAIKQLGAQPGNVVAREPFASFAKSA